MEEETEESDIETDHGHAADVLMSDYGIPREMRRQVCEEIKKVWVWDTMPHDFLIASVRGYLPRSQSMSLLRSYLESHKTHEPKNHNNITLNSGSLDALDYYFGQF